MIYVLVAFFDIIVIASIVAAIVFWRRSKKYKDNKQEKKKMLYSIVTAIIAFALFVVAVQQMPDDSSSSSEPTTQQSSSTTSSSSSQTTEESKTSSSKSEDTSSHYSQKQVKAINKELVAALKDDQKDATDGNSNYNYANYLVGIKIQPNKTALVYVDGDNFLNLSDDDKQIVGERTSGLIGRAIVTAGVNYSPEENRNGVYMSFYNGPQAIGHSKTFNHTEFKWYKQ